MAAAPNSGIGIKGNSWLITYHGTEASFQWSGTVRVQQHIFYILYL